MKKRTLLLLAACLTALLLLTGCQGSALPEGMEDTVLLSRGREVVAALNDGQWETIYSALREDAKSTTSPDGIRTYMETVLEEAGPYEAEEENLLTGQKLDSGELYGTAVLYCRHEKDDVVYRIAYSPEMELMGLQVSVK